MTGKISFLHLRDLTTYGDISGRGGATVAYRQRDDGTIEYAVSWCSPHDNFNKSYGRAKAAGRLNSDRFCEIAKETNLAEFRENVYNNKCI